MLYSLPCLIELQFISEINLHIEPYPTIVSFAAVVMARTPPQLTSADSERNIPFPLYHTAVIVTKLANQKTP